ncbi:ester cyclase [Streptacidiphilus monticola]
MRTTPRRRDRGFPAAVGGLQHRPSRPRVHGRAAHRRGDEVVARLRVRGAHTGYHPRMPQPTGRSCDVEQIWIFTVRDGRIAELRAVSDRLGMFLQLGWDWPSQD